MFSVGDIEADPGLARPVLRRGRRPGLGDRRRPYSGSWPTAACCWPPAGPCSSLSSTTGARSGTACAGSYASAPSSAPSGSWPPFRFRPRWALVRASERSPSPACSARSCRTESALATLLGLFGLGPARAGVTGAGCRWRSAPRSAAGSFALSGHTRSTDNEVLAVGAAIVHTLAAAVWFGGLVLLALTLAGRRDEADHSSSAGMVARFSLVATVSVVAVGPRRGRAVMVRGPGAVGPHLHDLRLDAPGQGGHRARRGPDRSPQPVPGGAGDPAVTCRAAGLVVAAQQRPAGGRGPGGGHRPHGRPRERHPRPQRGRASGGSSARPFPSATSAR